MIKALWCRFQRYFGPFTMLLVQGFSEAGLFRNFSDYFFGVRNFEITKSMSIIIFVKMFKISSGFQKCRKIMTKDFVFLRKLNLHCIVKLSRLRTGYISSAANVITSSPNIWHVNKRDIFKLNWLDSDQWIW